MVDKTKSRAKSRRHYERHIEAERARSLAYYRANREEGIARARAWKVANPEKSRANDATYRTRRRARLEALKAGPCVDCGVTYPPYVMDFDHRDGSGKVMGVGAMYSRNLATLLAEIAKCDLVCANCHRERTFGGSRDR